MIGLWTKKIPGTGTPPVFDIIPECYFPLDGTLVPVP